MWVCEHPASLEATQVLSRMRTSETESADVCFSWGIYRFLNILKTPLLYRLLLDPQEVAAKDV